MKTTNLKKGMIAIIFAVSSLNSAAQGGYGEIRGIVKDTEFQPVPFATVKILQGNMLIGGTQTDAEGHYKYKPLIPGSYDMVVLEAGHQIQPVNKIAVIPNEATYVDVKLNINTLTTVTIVAKAIDYTKSGVDKTMYSIKTLDATELVQLAGYTRGDIKGALSSVSSDVIESPDGEVHVRGARGEASGYYVDGVRTLSSNTIPGLAIENLTFFSGGVPAMYGDMTSGAVMITTKSYFSGIREKTMRNQEIRERQEAQRAEEKAKKDGENRKKEIELEKLQEKK
jgi:hypothetical protein